MTSMRAVRALGPLLFAFGWTAYCPAATLNWTVDSTQSTLSLAVPNQSVSVGGMPWGNALFRNQGATSGTWTIGHQAPIAGTIATVYDDFNSIEFLGGQHALVALNSGNYIPDPASWDVPSSTFSPTNTAAPAAFGGQIGASSPGGLLIVVSNIIRFSLRDVVYDLTSGSLPIAAQQFAANGAGFEMADAEVAAQAVSSIAGQSLDSTLDSLAITGISIGGSNTAAIGGVTAPDPLSPNLRRLSLPVSVPITMNLYGGAVSTLNGTATGTIVAYAMVPEPSSWVLGLAGLAVLAWARRHRRCSRDLQAEETPEIS